MSKNRKPCRKLSKAMMMMLVIGLVMTCHVAANKPSKTTGWVDSPSGYRFLSPLAVKN